MAITSTVTPESSVDAELHPDADAVRAEAAPTRGHIGASWPAPSSEASTSSSATRRLLGRFPLSRRTSVRPRSGEDHKYQ
jgi:hypothetical protein